MLHIYMGPATAAQGQKPSSYSPESRNARGPLWMNDMLTGLRCSTFETFSFCLMAKVLAASLSTQQLQMLCCDRQIPLSPPSPWDCADGTRCPAHIGAHLTHGAENEGAKFLRMVKRYNLSVILAALVMLENYRFSIPELHLSGFINTTQRFWHKFQLNMLQQITSNKFIVIELCCKILGNTNISKNNHHQSGQPPKWSNLFIYMALTLN